MATARVENRGGTGYGGGNNRGGGYNQERGERPKHNFPLDTYQSDIQKWITSQIDRGTISFAEEAGKFLAKNQMTTSQIRIAFGELRKIQMNGFEKEQANFLMLTPKLAYAAERHGKEGIWMFYEFFKFAASNVDISKVEDGKKHFDNLIQVVEAVLAYHKSFGGKE